MENFLSRLNRNPYAPIDSASITRVDELGNGYDDWNNLIAPKFEAPQQTWGETALGVATAPARLATALAGSLSPYGAEGWQVPPVAQEGWNALTAVGDAYNYGMTDDEINSRALGMAGFMMGGGGLAARPTVRAAPAQIAAKSEMDIAMENLRRAVDDDLGDKSPYWNRPLEPRDLTLYHGTGSEFDRFNTTDVWASDSADMASNWAMRKDNPSVIPLEVKGARITRPKDQTLDSEAERARALAEGYDAIDWGKFDGGNYYQLVRPGTVKSPTTGETLFSNASKEGAVPAIASALDMSHEARLARAKEMGFDTDRTLYHGTDKEFDAFAPSRDGSLGSGVYLTPSEAYAGKYGQNILETYIRGNILDETDVPASVSRGLSGPWKRNRTPATAVADWARANGYDGIRQEGFQTVVFDPKNIRSVNAAFDPAKSDSANLLASNADSKPALLAGALGQEQKGITALDMGKEARLARMSEQSYQPGWLHGSWDTGITEIDPSKFGSRFGRESDSGGFITTTNPEVANYYAQFRHGRGFDQSLPFRGYDIQGAVYPLATRAKNPLLADASFIAEKFPQWADDAKYSGDGGQVFLWDLAGKDLVDYAKANGNDAVVLNAADGKLQLSMDPRNIRSVNAAFDPSMYDSTNILAANADVRPALLTGQDQPDDILSLLGYR